MGRGPRAGSLIKMCMALWIIGGKPTAAGDNNRRTVDAKRILKRYPEALARPSPWAVEIHSPPQHGGPLGGNLEGRGEAGEPDSQHESPSGGTAERRAVWPRNRLVSEL